MGNIIDNQEDNLKNLHYWKDYFIKRSDIKNGEIEQDEIFSCRTRCFIPDLITINDKEDKKFDEDFQNKQSISFEIEPKIGNSTSIKQNTLNENLRKKVVNLNQFPRSAIGVIIFETQNGKLKQGTGTLIASNLVLTCANNLYDNEINKPYKNHNFYIGVESCSYSESSNVINSFYPDEYKRKCLRI